MTGFCRFIGPGHLRLKYLELYGENPIVMEDTVWDDLRFPATAINPPGQVSDPDWDATIGGWLFDSGSTELIYLIVEMPHTWKQGTSLFPHVHWTKTSAASGNVLWKLQYRWIVEGGVMDADWTTLTGSTVEEDTPDNDLANEYLVTPIGIIVPPGKVISDVLIMHLSRVGGDGLDTYGADARLTVFDVHIESERPGTSTDLYT